MFGNLALTVSNSLLIHTGYFQISARLMLLTAIGAPVVAAVTLLGSPTIVSFMATYAAVYICAALLHSLFALRGPIRLTRRA